MRAKWYNAPAQRPRATAAKTETETLSRASLQPVGWTES